MARIHRLAAVRAKAKRGGWLRWIRTEADERFALDGGWFEQRRADHVAEFGRKYLVHTEGQAFAGKPFEFMRWQREQLFGPLYGWVHNSEEWRGVVRRYRQAYVQVPKKNGKSPTGAFVGLYSLCADNEFGANVFSVATSRDQASIVHGHAVRMVQSSDLLSAELKINMTTKAIKHEATFSTYAVLGSAPRRNEGWNGHACVADELHMWRGRELFDALRWMFASRPSPLFFQITTAGDDTASVCYDQYEYAKSVLSGATYDPHFLPVIYEAAPGDDPGDPATWRKANPSFGETVKESEMRSAYEQAKHSKPALERFCQLRLNQWRTGVQGWLDASQWDAGGERRKEHAA